MFGLVPFGRRNGEIARKGDIDDLRSVFDDFFNDSFLTGFTSAGAPIRADIRETEKEYIIEAEIPGVNKGDIKLELRDDILTISTERREETNEERNNYIRKERRYGSYSRSFHVENVKNEETAAKYDNGVLTVTLPKLENARIGKHNIEIQ